MTKGWKNKKQDTKEKIKNWMVWIRKKFFIVHK